MTIWITFQLSAICIIGIPLTLLIWSIKRKNKAVEKLLTNFSKISILYFISLILFVGKQDFALLILNISNVLMTISVWFWSDINVELSEYRISHPLAMTTKAWRWSLTFLSIGFLYQSIKDLSCTLAVNNDYCSTWLEPSKDLFKIINNIFNFLFGANFSEPIAKFIGLFALLIYILGLIQFLIIKLPKTGRNSNFSNYEDN